jgi:hypothetical protein
VICLDQAKEFRRRTAVGQPAQKRNQRATKEPKMQLSEPRSRYELPPGGTHLARLYRFVDLGWQTSTYEDEARDQHQAILGWELCGRLMADGRPYVVSKTINLSLHEKSTFRGWAEAMVGREFGPADLAGRNRFDVKELLGAACLIQVEHGTSRKGNLFAKVANLMQAPEDVKAPPPRRQVIQASLPDILTHCYQRIRLQVHYPQTYNRYRNN